MNAPTRTHTCSTELRRRTRSRTTTDSDKELRTIRSLKHQYRFFVPPECIQDGDVALPPAVARQMRDVLRLKPGDPIILLDGSGEEFVAELREIGRAPAAAIIDRRANTADPSVSVTLFQSTLKAKKMETIWQKATEIGVGALAPVATLRSVVAEPNRAKTDRLTEIVREAAEQSGRGRLPQLLPARQLKDALDSDVGLKLLFCPSTRTTAQSLSAVMKGWDHDTAAILIGPEGGFSDAEVALAVSRGWQAISLGPRILRAETAGIVAVGLVLHIAGELE